MKPMEKGTYGYLNQRKKMLMILTLICFAIVFIILFAGILICKTKNNILTVFAILTVLPSAKVMVSWLMLIRYNTPNQDYYKKVCEQVKQLPILSDCVVTCKDKTVFVPYAVISDTTIYCYTSNAQFDEDYFEKNTMEFIKKCGDSVSVKLYKEFESFLKKVHTADVSADMDKIKKINRLKEDFLILVL